MRPFSPGATLPWIAAVIPMACSHPPPAPILTSRTATSSTPSPQTHRARCSRPFVAGEPGCRRQAQWFLGFCLRVHLLALLLDGPYGGGKTGEPGRRRQASVSWILLEGALAGSVTIIVGREWGKKLPKIFPRPPAHPTGPRRYLPTPNGSLRNSWWPLNDPNTPDSGCDPCFTYLGTKIPTCIYGNFHLGCGLPRARPPPSIRPRQARPPPPPLGRCRRARRGARRPCPG